MWFCPRRAKNWSMIALTCVLICVAMSTGVAQQNDGSTEQLDQPATHGEEISYDEIVEPVTSSQVKQSIERGITFLLDSQNPNGSWGSPTKTKDLNIYAPVPGAHHAFTSGTTALCISALCELEAEHPEVTPAIERGQTWLLEHLPQLKRATPDAIYNVWGHGYGILALARLHQRSRDDQLKSQLVALIETQFERLADYESVDGGWGYYDFRAGAQQPTSSSTSFVNATVLIAFYEAKQLGVEPPERLTRRAVDATLRQQKSDMTYIYGEYLKNQPVQGINRPGGSLGRSQACNLAMRLWGDQKVTDQVLEEWLDRMIRRHGWLDIGRKRPIPHESWMQVAGYFFYYGHYYAACCCEQLPKDDRARFSPYLASLLVQRQETDGSWWDYPLYNYHPPYGTAFALMSLRRYQKEIP